MTRVAQWQRDARACHAAALAAVEPEALVAAALLRREGRVELRDPMGGMLARHTGPVHLLAVGKAAAAMARAAVRQLGPALVRGLVVVPDVGAGAAPAGLPVIAAGHPEPTPASARAGEAALALASATGPDTLFLALLSGGTSPLVVVPAGAITLADKQEVTRLLLAAGADIGALNTVRKHCSRLKGGGLLRAAAAAAATWTLVLSDVLGDDLATVASGLTVADPTTFAEALAVLDRYAVRGQIPPTVLRHLEAGVRGAVPETLASDDPLLARSRTVLLAGNATAVDAARRIAEKLGYATTVLPPLVGDAAEAGRRFAARVRALPEGQARALVAGAEPTVRVVAGGRGGRAQHFALAAALALDGIPGVVLAVGTDGVDGPTDAAGALVDGGLAERARRAGIDLEGALVRTDSHPVLDALGALVRTGPTGTNVTDLVVALRGPC